MRKQLKTIVQQDFEMMSPLVIRDEGNVPPLLFFHFKDIKPEVVEAMATTVQEDVLKVESGFFVPMTRQSILENKTVFMEFMATIMAALKTVGITKELLYVVIAVTGKAMKIDTKTNEKEAEADVFIVSGINEKGETFTVSREIKLSMGPDAVVCDLVESGFLDEGINNTAEAFIGKDFFELYKMNLERIPTDKANLGVLEDSRKEYEGDEAAFTADLVDSAIHATVLLDSINH